MSSQTSKQSEGKQKVCPVCGKPIQDHARFCYSCYHFIDPDTNTVRNYNQISDQEIEQLIAEGDAARKQWRHSLGLVQMILATILILIGFAVILYYMVSPHPLACLLGLLPMALGYLLLVHGQQYPDTVLNSSAFKTALAQSLIPSVLDSMFDKTEAYDPQGHFSEEFIRQTKLVPQKWDKLEGSDLVSAVYHGHSIEMSDIVLLKRDDTADDTHHDEPRYDTVFRGYWMVLDLDRPLNADMFVVEKDAGTSYRDSNTVSLDHAGFNNRFWVSCADPLEVFQILTPVRIEKIMALNILSQGRISLKFLQDGRLIIAVHTGHDMLFDVHQTHETTEHLRSRFTEDLRRLLALPDALELLLQ